MILILINVMQVHPRVFLGDPGVILSHPWVVFGQPGVILGHLGSSFDHWWEYTIIWMEEDLSFNVKLIFSGFILGHT